MKICLATRHRTASFIPLSLLYLKAYLVEREGRRPEDVPIVEFDRDTPDPEPPYYATSHLSMNGGDFQYGWQITDACEQLQRSRTARLLARKPDEDVRAFVAAVCEKRQIPPEFYRHFAALEFAS